jgi:hypothetical protein
VLGVSKITECGYEPGRILLMSRMLHYMLNRLIEDDLLWIGSAAFSR